MEASHPANVGIDVMKYCETVISCRFLCILSWELKGWPAELMVDY